MYRFIFGVLFLVIVSPCFAKQLPPLVKVKMPYIEEDDLHFENMLKAISRQLKSFESMSLNESFKFGNKKIKRSHLKYSLVEFRKYVVGAMNCFQIRAKEHCYEDFYDSLKANFEAYIPKVQRKERGHKTKETYFTAYYSPDLEGSYTQSDVYKNPIYAMPTSTKLRSLTSDEINYEGKLKNKGLELFYVKESLFEIWLLHVEGGGRVKVRKPDGSFKKYYLSYAGTNKQSFRMLAKYMLDQGMLTRDSIGVHNQKAFFNNNPDKQREILAYCPSYVFFKTTEVEPLGVKNIPLTPGRSLATDYRKYKEYGIINFVKAKKPILVDGKLKNKEFSRFFINQDTGGAIKGRARADLYFGYGKDAELAANYLGGLGKQYFLILK